MYWRKWRELDFFPVPTVLLPSISAIWFSVTSKSRLLRNTVRSCLASSVSSTRAFLAGGSEPELHDQSRSIKDHCKKSKINQRSIQINPDLSRSIQIYPDQSRSIQINPDLSSSIQIYPDRLRSIKDHYKIKQ